MWPEEFAYLLEGSEEVALQIAPAASEGAPAGKAVSRKALKARVTQQDFEKIWPLAEARYRLGGALAGKAITLITNNPHYQSWHPSDGGSVESVSGSGHAYTTRYVIVHFLLDDVRETVEA
ncbi:hypothetical protein [Rhizobium sp. RU20A]|uniref:hypothetical protein n=1 Tax=Rhizobium sp. RU20A TaxID=1907412 RepID=UPI00122CED13|nr:hypothetical protein [Rhizobium sp. RU20A]